MMSAEEIASAWKEIVQIRENGRSNNTFSPEKDMMAIVDKFGLEQTEEVFATIAAIKKNDGRIYGLNRDYMNTISVDSQNTEWRSENPVLYAGLDDIHPAHINQLITELRKIRSNNN